MILPLIVLVGYGLYQALNVFLFAPWAYGILGRQTLTGDWTGTLTTHSGVRYALHLQLNHSSQALTGPRAPDIDGRVWWCGRGVPSATAPLAGQVQRLGSHVTLDVQRPVHPQRGLSPTTFQGSWHGSPLKLRVLFLWYSGRAYVSSLSHPDEYHPVAVTLHKSGFGAYRAACARL